MSLLSNGAGGAYLTGYRGRLGNALPGPEQTDGGQ